MNKQINKVGQIFLGGGGGEKESVLLDKKFINSLKRKKIAYIPIALEVTDDYSGCYDWISTTLGKFSSDLEITMWTELSNKQLSEVSKYDAIYMGGGNTYRLLNLLYKSGFDKVLWQFYKQGGCVYGGSAGAIVLGETISTVKFENDQNYLRDDGLDLLSDWSVFCHYRVDKDRDRIRKFVKKKKNNVIALPENAGLIVDYDGKFESVGFGPAYIFSQDTERSFDAGQVGSILTS